MATKLGLAGWAQIAEIVGGFAIIASLIFVGLEVRHATQQLQLSSDINADLDNADLSIRIAESPELSHLVWKAERDPESLSDEEMARFENLALPRLAMWENTYDSFLAGNFTESGWLQWDTFYRSRFNKPGYRLVYVRFRYGFGQDSREYFSDVFEIED